MILRKFCNFIQVGTIYYLLGLLLGVLRIGVLFLVIIANGIFLNYIF